MICSSFSARSVWKLHKSIKFPAAHFPFEAVLAVQISLESVSQNSFYLGCRRRRFYDIIKPNMMSWLPDLRKDGAAFSHISWPPKSVSFFKQCLSFDVLWSPVTTNLKPYSSCKDCLESAVLAVSLASLLLVLMLDNDLNKPLTLMLNIGLLLNLNHLWCCGDEFCILKQGCTINRNKTKFMFCP